MGPWSKVLKGIALVSQIGISIITPPVLMALLGSWLCGKFGIGPWLTLIFIIFGLLASGSTAYSFYRKFYKEKTEEEKPSVSFREHR